jgi:hypothetical protein
MKLNFGLLGIALAQSGDYVDDSSDERHDYSYDYNLGNHHHNHNHHNDFGHHHNMSFNQFGGKGSNTTKRVLAQRLSCWNSNSLRDMNHDQKFFDFTNDMYHHYNHQYGFENAYYHEGNHGTHELQDYGDVVDQTRLIDVDDPGHSVVAIDPVKWGYQSDNRDAKYHYGHHIHDEDRSSNPNRPHHYQISDNEGSFDGVIDDWRYSLRHAGCLYEIPDYFYGATTFNTLRYLTYSMDFHDYPNADHVEDNISPRKTNVHWVHVFNAHIHIDSNTYCAGEGAANNHAITENDCINTDKIHQFAVVMANPTYEGLGFLNFVATYHDPHVPATPAEEAGHRFRSNYEFSALYENSGYWHLSSIGTDQGNTGVTWHLQCDSAGCSNTNWNNGTNNRGLAISSFPHNQLGKDFRFNIRTLHTMGDGWHRASLRTSNDVHTAYSYFFYGISSIQIQFPEYVGHYNDCWRFRNVGACTNDMVHQIIVDQSSVQVTSASPQNTHGDIAYGNHQFLATLSHSDTRCQDGLMGIGHGAHGSNACASWCANTGQVLNGHNSNTQITITNAATNTNTFCGDLLTITGIHRTYDELHLRQFGTIQEIWVQLMYAYSHATTYDGSNNAVEGFESPFPNVFFSAPQVLAVTGSCSDTSYGKCDGYTRIQNVPYAGSDTDAVRWAADVDGLGSQRGDSFWPDDHDYTAGR